MNKETVTSTDQTTQAEPQVTPVLAQPPKTGLWMLVAFSVLLVLLIAFNMK